MANTNRKPIAKPGDIVHIVGQDGRYEVMSVTHEEYTDIDVSFSDIYYDAINLETYESVLFDQSQISVVEGEDKRKLAPIPAEVYDIQTDRLLDELNDVMTVIAVCGDEGGEYGERAEGIKQRLSEIVEERRANA